MVGKTENRANCRVEHIQFSIVHTIARVQFPLCSEHLKQQTDTQFFDDGAQKPYESMITIEYGRLLQCRTFIFSIGKTFSSLETKGTLPYINISAHTLHIPLPCDLGMRPSILLFFSG